MPACSCHEWGWGPEDVRIDPDLWNQIVGPCPRGWHHPQCPTEIQRRMGARSRIDIPATIARIARGVPR